MANYSSFAANHFTSLQDVPFAPSDYSHLKFGCDGVARRFGYELAEKFFSVHSDVLMANNCVVIPSPYNFIKNAATVMTMHFVNRLNELLVMAQGNHVEYSIIHRKVSYTNDYGFLSKEKRKGLIDNDTFYLNREFIKGKLLIFVDDVRITGTHEEKLIDVLSEKRVKNDAFFIYFGQYDGFESPTIEAELNFAGIKTVDDYIDLASTPNHHVIVRPIKFVLGLEQDEFKKFLDAGAVKTIHEIYLGALGEGYYRIPKYQDNFNALASHCNAS